MYFYNSQTSSLALLALLFSSALATPIVADLTESDLQKKSIQPILSLRYYAEQGFGGTWWYDSEGSRENKGDCFATSGSNKAQSAKAPQGFKCTMYSDKGCHGWRTKEFGQDGLADLGTKMNNNAESWRCCKIGTTNYWGYCSGAFNAGS